MPSEVREYTSEDIANQVRRLQAAQPRDESVAGYRHIITVGPWAPEALGIVREERLWDVLNNYRRKLPAKLWTPEELFRPDELMFSKMFMSRSSQIALAVIALTEGGIDAYARDGFAVFRSPAIIESHRDWVREESRHDEISNMASEVILGPKNSEIKELISEIIKGRRDLVATLLTLIKKDRISQWSHTQHPGIGTEIGHGLYIPIQEDVTADSDERADDLYFKELTDYLDVGQWIAPVPSNVGRDFGLGRIYQGIKPEERRHSGLGVNRSRVEFGLSPLETLRLFGVVREGFGMPGESYIPNSRKFPRILHGSLRAYLEHVSNAFDRTAKNVFGISEPTLIPVLTENIIALNETLTTPQLRIVKKDGSLEEYKAA